MNRTVLAILVLCSTALHAQQSPLVGTWQLSYPIGMQIDDGVPTVLTGTGVLTVEARQDSLLGTLVTDPQPGLPTRPPSRLAAKAATGEVVFTARAPGVLNVNGTEREITVVSTWKLTAAGDSLRGTVQREIEGFFEGFKEPQPVAGTRKK